jgi:F-type H+-transporting ATPase subunit b
MLINPWIVLAEIFNFLILVAVLQRFLYKPIMQAMAKREQSIAGQMRSAEARETEAQAHIQQYEQLQAQWDKQTEVRQRQMQQQVETEHADLLKQVRTELENQKTQWNAALRQEQKASLVELRDRARSQLIQTARSTLKTLANTTLEQQMVETFLRQLPTLLAADLDGNLDVLKASVAAPNNVPEWTIRSAFPLDEPLKQRLVEGIQAQLAPQVPFDAFTFETDQDYSCGIELHNKGYKLAWNLDRYLNNLESKLADDLTPVPVF